MRKAAPEHLSRSLLVRILAYKIQARVLGELDRETTRYLDRVANEQARRRRAGERRPPKAPPPVPPVPVSFSWNGTIHTSLSEIARRITGTRWNGPRFFGLRDRQARLDEARP